MSNPNPRWNRAAAMVASAVAAAFALSLAVPATASAADKKIEKLWKTKCASCHGVDGKGETDTGKEMAVGDMTSAAFWKDLTDAKIKDTINAGLKREKNGKQQEMKPFKAALKPEEIDGLVEVVKGFKK